jgi:hypothetical protein
MDLREIRFQDVDCVNLAQDKEWWWIFVNTIINFVLHKGQLIFLSA